MPDTDWPTELVQGQMIAMPPPKPRHGQLRARIIYLIQRLLEDNPLGQVLGNDSGVITERNPDTVRGADVAFYSYQRVPKGPLPNTWLSVAPDLVFEVLSPEDRWSEVQTKVDEYLQAGVQVVCVVDDGMSTIHVFRNDNPAQVLRSADELSIPNILPGFNIPLRRIFE
jgi:Uma2 family endonuclease